MRDGKEGGGGPLIAISAKSCGMGEGQIYIQRRIPRRLKPDELVINCELTVLMFSMMVTKEGQ